MPSIGICLLYLQYFSIQCSWVKQTLADNHHMNKDGLSYEECLSECSIASLKTRKHAMCKHLFQKMQSPKDKLHRLLPAEKSQYKKSQKLLQVPYPFYND